MFSGEQSQIQGFLDANLILAHSSTSNFRII